MCPIFGHIFTVKNFFRKADDLHMKLAEALQERADLNSKINELRCRLGNNATVQEGEAPAEYRRSTGGAPAYVRSCLGRPEYARLRLALRLVPFLRKRY